MFFLFILRDRLILFSRGLRGFLRFDNLLRNRRGGIFNQFRWFIRRAHFFGHGGGESFGRTRLGCSFKGGFFRDKLFSLFKDLFGLCRNDHRRGLAGNNNPDLFKRGRLRVSFLPERHEVQYDGCGSDEYVD
jgi:hypothetical protein